MAKSPSLTDITGIGVVAANALQKAGIKTPEDMARANVKQIVAVYGFGPIKAAAAIEAAKALLKTTPKAKKGGSVKKGKAKKKKRDWPKRRKVNPKNLKRKSLERGKIRRKRSSLFS
jgi:predicted RecB family nuclease